jgi:hypothetical protein
MLLGIVFAVNSYIFPDVFSIYGENNIQAPKPGFMFKSVLFLRSALDVISPQEFVSLSVRLKEVKKFHLYLSACISSISQALQRIFSLRF